MRSGNEIEYDVLEMMPGSSLHQKCKRRFKSPESKSYFLKKTDGDAIAIVEQQPSMK